MRRRLLIAGSVLAACAFAGGTYAASSEHSNARQAFLNDVAKRLHVSPQQLKSAFQGAVQDQLNAAVKAGKLTPAEANAIEKRLREGAPPMPFFHRGLLPGAPGQLPFHGPFLALGALGAAAQYIGVGPGQLFDQLSSGKSLAQIAKAHGKSVSGLQSAMVTAERSRLDQARKDGLISSAQEQRLVSRLQSKISALVNRAGFGPHLHPLGGRRPFFGPKRFFGPRAVPPGFVPPGALVPGDGPPPVS